MTRFPRIPPEPREAPDSASALRWRIARDIGLLAHLEGAEKVAADVTRILMALQPGGRA